MSVRINREFDDYLIEPIGGQQGKNKLNKNASYTSSAKSYVPDLSGFINLCDVNYAKLMRLLPDFALKDQRCFGLSRTDQDLGLIRITVLERCKYTTMLRLEQGSNIDFLPPTNMQVRLYHDASMAEVMSYQGMDKIRERYHYSDHGMCQKDEKALCNEFLSDWLSYCLKFGHETETT